jgi:hypothetical protein
LVHGALVDVLEGRHHATAPAGADGAAAGALARRLSDAGCLPVCQTRMTSGKTKNPTATPAQKGQTQGVRAVPGHQRTTDRGGLMFGSFSSGKRDSADRSALMSLKRRILAIRAVSRA